MPPTRSKIRASTSSTSRLPTADYLQTVLTSRLGGQSPDIYHVYSIWGAQLVENGILATPPENVVEFVQNNYIDNTVDAASIQGQLWGVPTEVRQLPAHLQQKPPARGRLRRARRRPGRN